MKTSTAFLAALHSDRRGWVCAIGDRDGFERPLWIDWRKPNASQLLCRFALDQGGARVSVSSYRSASSRKASNVLACRAVMADFDGSQLWRFATPAPSIVVASGGQTEGRAHAHALWLLADRIDVAEVRKLCRGQADLLDGDRAFSAGATATVRLPLDGSELLRFDPVRSQSIELRQRHRLAKRTTRPTPVDAPADLQHAIKAVCDRRLSEVEQGGSRNVAGWELAGDLHRLGIDEVEAVGIGEDWHARVSELVEREHDEPLSELLSQIRRRFAGGSASAGRAYPQCVDRWEEIAVNDPELAATERTGVSTFAGAFRQAGSERVTMSLRQLAIATRSSLATADRIMHGSKSRKGLLGSYLRKAGKGAKGAQKYAIRLPNREDEKTALASATQSTTTSYFSVNCSRTVPPSHDGWSYPAIGHGPRVLFDLLLTLDRPVNASELTASPALSDHARTIRRQLDVLRAFDLARRLPDGTWVADADNLEAKLDTAAEATGTAGLADRLHRQHSRERIAFARARAAFANKCATERERRRANLLRRRRPHRRRQVERDRLGSQPTNERRRWSWTQSTGGAWLTFTSSRVTNGRRSLLANYGGGVPGVRFGQVAVP